ncbi:MAG: NAD(P)-dependent oxidoreductase [Pseudomonadales bacterium]|jgi:3-hydroxyisobutyrate dehydrogenase|nr:NAD(P)-dependent oxidoreductase [Pseudomonadales bacterium]
MSNVAFIGLGTMGYPMAGHLSKAGHQVRVYNRNAAKAQAWQAEHGGTTAPTPAAAAQQRDFVFLCVGNDDDLRQVCLGENGVFAAAALGSVIVDHTTTSATVARELAEKAAQAGFHFIDAPVSGGQAGAQNGKLSVMAGGDAAAFARAEPVIRAFAASVRLLGPSGYGQLTKMGNQICIAGLVQALSEGIHFAKCAGLDVAAVIDVISKGAASSWQMQNRWETMLNDKFDFGFAVDWMRKDLGIAKAEAARNGAQLPVTALVDEYYAEVQKMGGGRWDTSSLIARLEKP